MEIIKRFRGGLCVCGLIASILLLTCIVMPGIDAASKSYFVCSNNKSPIVSERPDDISTCCAGSVVEMTLNRKNLMSSLKEVASALRVLPRGKTDQLEGPESLAEKSACYLRSVQFIAGAVKEFPPEKNKDQVAEYNQYLDQLNSGAARIIDFSQGSSQRKALVAFSQFQDTCGSCHSKFR